jgi:hypothetical protein
LPPTHTYGDGNAHHQNGEWHPKLDVNAEDVESLYKDVQGRFPRWEDKTGQPKNILF